MSAKTPAKKAVKPRTTVVQNTPVAEKAVCEHKNVEIFYKKTGCVAASFVKHLEEKLKSMDFNKNFLTLNFDGLSIVIDTPNFYFSIDKDGMVTFRKVAKPIAIEVYVSIDRLIFVSRGPKPE